MGSSKYAPPRHSVLHNASCLIARRFLFAAGAALAKERWANKNYVENDYYLHRYWLATVDDLDSTTKRYMEIEREVDMLRRRHAEKVNQFYGTMREQHVKDKGYWKDYLRRPTSFME
ncbi:hypothetical protein C1H46_024547 [Malus baccata]|uniref:Uncharacterized protein n=1 Tax=Malus baccata TaxID=106549 RepID=A0A540LU40_MALBA|nr:hypothetical protein C1H46_024547 [Malus baccata]